MKVQLIITICFLALAINVHATNEITSNVKKAKAITKDVKGTLKPLGILKPQSSIIEEKVNDKLVATVETKNAIIYYAPIIEKKKIKLKRNNQESASSIILTYETH